MVCTRFFWWTRAATWRGRWIFSGGRTRFREKAGQQNAMLCSRNYQPHAKATLEGGHVAIVLTPSQEIRVFANGTTSFIFSHGRWRLLDIASCFEAWCEAVGKTRPGGLAGRIFQAALNLAEQRQGRLVRGVAGTGEVDSATGGA